MNEEYQSFRDQMFSTLHALAKKNSIYDDARMLVGSAETSAKLVKHNILKNIETDWIDAIEEALPYLDIVIRMPTVAIEDVEEILPLELSRHVGDRSVKHLATHTNLIQDIRDDDVIPLKILNVHRDETYLTYENKFVNTLLARLAVFVDKRFRALVGGRGTERKYQFDYSTEFEHHLENDGGRNSAKVTLSIELTAPAVPTGAAIDMDEKYRQTFERLRRIHQAILSFQSSVFAEKLGRAYIRPPVIRTNAILKNKNMKECLRLWEFIESFDKVGYSVQNDGEATLPTSDYISDLHSTVALQYVNFYNGVTESEGNRMLSRKHLIETEPEFAADLAEQQSEDYLVYDSEYRKMVPVSRLIDNRRKLSEDERRIADAITIALRTEEYLLQAKREAEARRIAELEAKRRAEEEERLRLAEEARLRAEEEARRQAEEDARRQAAEQARLRAEIEAQRQAEAARLRAQEEARLKDIEDTRRRMDAKSRQMEQEQAERERAEDNFLPEDGDLTGRNPICPFTRRQYQAMGRKRKKTTKANMDKVATFRDNQNLIVALCSMEDADMLVANQVKALEAQCDNIRNEMSGMDNWLELLRRYTLPRPEVTHRHD